MMFRTTILIVFLALLCSYVSAICYFPDGSVSAQDTPCDDASAEATCCGQGYVCLSNHICKATGDEIQRPGATLYVRGSCTDKLWRSSSCPNFCVDTEAPNFDFTSGGNGMGKCSGTTDDMYYCINHNVGNVDCGKKMNIVSFRGEPRELTTIGRAASTSPTSTSSKPSPSSTTLSTTSTLPAGLSPAASSTTTPPAPQQPDANNQPQPSISAGAIIGASVGGSAAVAACALAGILWYRRKRKATRDAHLSQPAYQPYYVPSRTHGDMTRYNYNYFDERKGSGAQELPGSHSYPEAYNHAPQPGPFELPHNSASRTT